MDTVVSCLGGTGGLLVLIERQTRLIFIARLAAITADAVRQALRRLLKSRAMKAVLSITTDNGCEFLNVSNLSGTVIGQ